MNIITELDFKNDLIDIAKLFDLDSDVKIDCKISEGLIVTSIDFDGKNYLFSDENDEKDMLVFKRLYKRFAKKHLYEVLKEKSKTILPWGNLTGIRPVKLYNQTVLEMGEEKADDYFINFYDVTRQKLDVVKEITKVQKKYLLNDGNTADIYVGIPFCKGKCSYCSFFSADIEKNKNLK